MSKLTPPNPSIFDMDNYSHREFAKRRLEISDDYWEMVESNLTSFYSHHYKELTKKSNYIKMYSKDDGITSLTMECKCVSYCFQKLIKDVSQCENVNSNPLTTLLFKSYGLESNKGIFQYMTYESHFGVFKDYLLTIMSHTLHKVCFPSSVDDVFEGIPVMLNTIGESQINFQSWFPLGIVWSHMGSLIKKVEESV